MKNSKAGSARVLRWLWVSCVVAACGTGGSSDAGGSMEAAVSADGSAADAVADATTMIDVASSDGAAVDAVSNDGAASDSSASDGAASDASALCRAVTEPTMPMGQCDGRGMAACQRWAMELGGGSPNSVATCTMAPLGCARADRCENPADGATCRCGAGPACRVNEVCRLVGPTARCECAGGA